ncbi:peroxisomal membrane protein pex14 [Vermiconidia calcicola]|uniref:Peroxisomal membrane protein pex14 n=1 Tax=Vermiconidia calcicola TaxID=1690605 RepID=A0ACC3N2M0_9PEZI|nr:peroxisomal membrane protein pex14 [Vermiconidia calcicola]
MVREDLIDGAVTFLQDPSVASAPLEQRLSFLRSKNLTQEEIDASLARVGQSPTAQQSQPTSSYPQQYRQQASQYGYQQPPPYWGQPPPEIPRRDWRDWFIMATVAGGVSYAMYWTARRWIYPLIAPPTPEQLEQDKASIDASFDKTFALLEQLSTDTQELKDAESSRKERLDRALAEVESVVSKMKEANEHRESEAKRWGREMEEIREQIPQAIQREKEGTEGKLKDLAVEMKSLKTLVANRMGQPQRASPNPSFGSSQQQQQAPNGVNGVVNGTGGGSGGVVQPTPPADTTGAGVNGSVVEESAEKPAPASTLPERSSTGSAFAGRTLGGKAQIPAWQLAAKKKAEDAKKEKEKEAANGQDVSESGTAADATEAGA